MLDMPDDDVQTILGCAGSVLFCLVVTGSVKSSILEEVRREISM